MTPDFDELLPELSQRLERIASLRHILAADIPCALWGQETFLWHSIPYFEHEAHVLVPDGQVTAAATALINSGEFTQPPPLRITVHPAFDAEKFLPGPCVRLFSTAKPLPPVHGFTMDTPVVEIFLIPASTYSVDIENHESAGLFDAHHFPACPDGTSPPSRPLLVPKPTTLITGMAAFFLGNSPHSHSSASYAYHEMCLYRYHYFSEKWDPEYPECSLNTEEEAAEVRRQMYAQLGAGTDAQWLYSLVIVTDREPEQTVFLEYIKNRQLNNRESDPTKNANVDDKGMGKHRGSSSFNPGLQLPITSQTAT